MKIIGVVAGYAPSQWIMLVEKIGDLIWIVYKISTFWISNMG